VEWNHKDGATDKETETAWTRLHEAFVQNWTGGVGVAEAGENTAMKLTQEQTDKLRHSQKECVPGGLLYIDSMTFPDDMAVVIWFNKRGMSELAGYLQDGELVRNV